VGKPPSSLDAHCRTRSSALRRRTGVPVRRSAVRSRLQARHRAKGTRRALPALRHVGVATMPRRVLGRLSLDPDASDALRLSLPPAPRPEAGVSLDAMPPPPPSVAPCRGLGRVRYTGSAPDGSTRSRPRGAHVRPAQRVVVAAGLHIPDAIIATRLRSVFYFSGARAHSSARTTVRFTRVMVPRSPYREAPSRFPRSVEDPMLRGGSDR